MRILMLDNEFPPLGGGTGVVNYHLLQEMAAYDDLHVDLVTSSRTADRYETDVFAPRILIYKVPVDNKNIHHASNRELLLYTWRGLRFSRKLLAQHRYDMSFAFAGVPAGAISYALKLTHGLPYLVSLQGPDVPGFEARYNYLYPVLTPLLRQVWRRAAIVTAISREHQQLAHRTMPGLAIPIVYNGVDTAAFHPSVESRHGEALNILCVGRLIERKGQHHLLRAFAESRRNAGASIRLTLAGTGDAEGSLRALAAELGVTDAVTFTGFVPRQEMPEIYRDADIFVLPSQAEGMSIALLEAMASGLPVIVTQTGGTEELVREGVNGHIVPWADVPALASALIDLTQDALARRSMGDANRRKAGDFSWAAIARSYVDMCAQVAAKPQAVSYPT